MGLTPELKEEITQLIRDLQVPDSIELGDSKGRVKVYVNFGKKKEAEDKITDALKILKDKRAEALE